jgi:hypothetical protein
MVNPEKVLSRYDGGREQAEKALLTIFHVTNKGLAHLTRDLMDHPEHGELLEIASRGVPSLVASYLYTPLGLPAPSYKITSRPRPAHATIVPTSRIEAVETGFEAFSCCGTRRRPSSD